MLKNIKTTAFSATFALLIASPAMAEEAAHHSSGGLPQFDPTSWPSQIFWLAVFFAILYTTFSKSVIPTLGKTIEARTSYIAENIKKAETLSAEAEALRQEVEAALKSAGQKANTDIVAAETAAKDKLTSALSDFRTRFEAQISSTEQRINAAKSEAMTEMEKIAVSLAAQAAEKIAGIPASESGAESVVKSLSEKAKRAA